MIAALASSLLGQIEGMGGLSAGVSGLGSLLGNGPDTGLTGGAKPPTASGAQNGRAATTPRLSDQLQALLLQQQAGQSGGTGPEFQGDAVDLPLNVG